MSTQVLEVLLSSTVSQVLEIPVAGSAAVIEVVVPATAGVVEVVTAGLQGLTGLQGVQGVQGVQGLQGVQGAAGSGGVSPVTFTQSVALVEWIVTHAFSYRPDVETYDNNGDIFFADVTYTSPTTVRVTHGFPMTGSIRLL